MDAHQRLLHSITRHRQYLTRTVRMVAAGERGWPLPKDAEFSADELKALDQSTLDLVIELRGSIPNDDEWMAPMAYSYKHGYCKDGEFGWLRSLEIGLKKSSTYLESYLITAGSNVHMGDNVTNVGSANVVLGAHSSARDITNSGSAAETKSTAEEIGALANELRELRLQLRADHRTDDPNHDIEAGNVAAAEVAARAGDAKGARAALASVSKWSLEVATKIGVSLATEAIKQATGLGN